ncbi:lamin tail domain-containing protein [Candidatus Woesearchaeota archaeon]|nr:lamin tail domain-containing protein [Candidatus Woesearchaeota archaeon]
MGWWENYIFFLLFLFTIISLPFVSAAIEINEISYDPSAASGGQYNEWVELWNDGNETTNFSNCFLDEKPLPSLSLPPQEFIIVARKPDIFQNTSSFNGTIIPLSLSLNNDGDVIILNGTCSSQFNYTSSLGASKNNRTLERRSDGTWGESLSQGGSPGKQNSIWEIGVIPTNISFNISTNTSLNTTIVVSPSKSCGVKLSLAGEPLFNSTNLNFSVIAENTENTSSDITVKGRIETIDGKLIKEYSPWTNRSLSTSLQQKYSPAIEPGVYLVTFSVENIACTDGDLSDNTVQKIFARSYASSSLNSTLSIESISLGSDKKARWGDQLPLRLTIYKGNESKNEIRVWAEQDNEKVSRITSFLLTEKYHLSTLTIPLQLDSNCNKKYSSGEIVVVVEGFAQRAEKIIPVSDLSSSLCKTINTAVSNTSSPTSRAASITLEVPSSVHVGDVLRVTAHLKGASTSSPPLSYRLSGYVYNGRKCYSCFNNTWETDADAKTILLDSNEEKKQDILLKIDPGIKEGKYMVKARFLQEGLKNPKEKTAEIYVLSPPSENTVSTLNSSSPPLLSTINPPPSETLASSSNPAPPVHLPPSGVIVYESTAAKSQKAIPYFLISTLVLLVLGISFRKA